MTDQVPPPAAPSPRFWRRAWTRVRGWCQRVWHAVQPGPTARRGTTWALLLTAVAAGLVAALDLRAGVGPTIDPLIAAGLVLVFLGLAFVLTVATARLVSLVPRFLSWPGVGAVGCLILALTAWAVPMLGAVGVVVTIAVGLGEALLGGAAALILAGGLRTATWPKRIWLLVVATGGIAANVWLVVWLLGPGSARGLVRAAPDPVAVAPLDLADPSRPGPFRVLTTTYGSGTDRRRPEFGASARLRTEPVDGRAFVKGSTGWQMTLRRWYWGFDVDRLPINGRVWYPEGAGPFPLVLIVHGNHSMEEYSDPGYAYLGEHLASHGYIFVSVDENFLNSSFRGSPSRENDARGWLLLQHLKVWQRWQETAGHPFGGRVAVDRIALVGHSRGGEAVAVAGAFNRLRRYPDDGRVEMPGGFGIRSVIAIAPVDGQYSPADRPTPLQDVNYLTLQGAHDADVSTFHGIRQWARVRFVDGAYHVKAAVYTYRANHGQFNTVWGPRDAGHPASSILDRAALLPGDAQRRVARVFITAFLEATLRDRVEWLRLFEDERRARHWLPDDQYVTRFSDSTIHTIANFEEDVDITTAAVPGVRIGQQGLVVWREGYLPFKEGTTRDGVVFLGWQPPPKTEAPASGAARTVPPVTPVYSIELPADLPRTWGLGADSTLRFALAQTAEEPDEEDVALGRPAGDATSSPAPKADRSAANRTSDPTRPERLDLSLELASANGIVVRLPLSRFRAIPVMLTTRMTKLWSEASIFGKRSEPVLQSFVVPLSAYSAADARFDPALLSSIRLVFDRSPKGVVALDEVGIGPAR